MALVTELGARTVASRSSAVPTTTRTSEAPSSIPSTLGLTLVFEPGISEYAWACLGTALGRAERHWGEAHLGSGAGSEEFPTERSSELSQAAPGLP